MEVFSDIAAFCLFLIEALVYALTGAVFMGLLDTIERIWLNANVTRNQYMMVLCLSFLLGMFLQWREMQHEVANLSKLTDSTHTQESLRSLLQDKENTIQDLKRQNDQLAFRLTAETKDLAEKQRQIGELQAKLDDRARRKAIREQLGKFIAKGEDLKRKCVTEITIPPPQQEADQWAEEVHNYLLRHLDSSFGARFRNPDPPMPISHSGVPEKHDGLWRGLNAHVAALRDLFNDLRD